MFAEGKLLDFFKFYDPSRPQHVEGVRRLERSLREKAPELLSDDAYWVQGWRTAPTEPRREVPAAALQLIKESEGCSLKAYVCPAGVLTIGYGHTGADVVPGKQITQDVADRLLEMDLERFERGVGDLVRVPLSDNEFGALVSFAFNVGLQAFADSTLLRKLNANDHAGAAAEFGRWVNGDAGPLPGLVTRREKERKLFLSGAAAPPKPAPARAVSVEAKVRPQGQSNSISCGQCSAAMAINCITGKHLTDMDFDAQHGFALLDGLNRECPGVRWRDLTPGAQFVGGKQWDSIAAALAAGFPALIALNGPEFSPSGYGHILLVVGIDGDKVRLADPARGAFRTVSKQLVETCPPHRQGKWVFVAERI